MFENNLDKEKKRTMGIEEDKEFTRTKENSVPYLIWTYTFWIVLVLLFFVWIFDFISITNGSEPKFHIQHKTHVFDDGKVEEYVGLGYKVFSYDRSSLKIKTQFTPFFVKMKK